MTQPTSYLITGGAGFIGSHVADVLVARDDRVTLVDNLSTGRLDNVRHLVEAGRVDLVEVSILDEGIVRKHVDQADVVIHLAASVGVELIVKHPLESLINNIRGTEVILEACSDFEKKVLVASTSEIYGKNADGPLHEDADRILGSPFKARWFYSTAKAIDEILAYAYWRDRRPPSIVARLFNCVGPRQTGAHGRVVPRFVRQALRGELLTVCGRGRVQRGRAERDDDRRPGASDHRHDGVDIHDRTHPLRRRVRGGVRGHGAACAGHLEGRSPHGLATDAIPGGCPA
jgi:UDP-glucose 4-epimerase